jgi:hypothetical protein
MNAFSKFLSGINNAGVTQNFHGTPQAIVYEIKVWWPWWPQHRRLGTTTHAASGIMPAWPFVYSHTEKCWSIIVQNTNTLLCVQRNVLQNLR